MLSTLQKDFLATKINEIGSALFISQHNSVLRFPTTVVTALKVDEAGQIWFLMNRPMQYLHEFDKEFPVKLDFYKKGAQSYLKIAGKAFIVSDPEEMNYLVSLPEDVKATALHQRVLVKVKILKAEYFENNPARKSSSFGTMLTRLYHRVFTPKPAFDFHPEMGY